MLKVYLSWGEWKFHRKLKHKILKKKIKSIQIIQNQRILNSWKNVDRHNSKINNLISMLIVLMQQMENIQILIQLKDLSSWLLINLLLQFLTKHLKKKVIHFKFLAQIIQEHQQLLQCLLLLWLQISNSKRKSFMKVQSNQ